MKWQHNLKTFLHYNESFQKKALNKLKKEWKNAFEKKRKEVRENE